MQARLLASKQKMTGTCGPSEVILLKSISYHKMVINTVDFVASCVGFRVVTHGLMHWKTSFEKKFFSALASKLNTGLINKSAPTKG